MSKETNPNIISLDDVVTLRHPTRCRCCNVSIPRVLVGKKKKIPSQDLFNLSSTAISKGHPSDF